MTVRSVDRKFRISRLFRDLLSDRSGGVYIWVGASLAAIVGFIALVVDMGQFYATKNQLKITADSAALAAAKELPDMNAARAAAIDYATKNMATGSHGNVLTNGDVVFGNWNTNTRTFTANATPTNAVSVTTRRAQANGNASQTYFGAYFGIREVDIAAAATATREAGQPSCIISLDTGSTQGALSFNSMDSAELNDCVPVANSTHNRAIRINSLDSFHAGSLYTSGGYQASSIDSFDLDEPAQTNQPALNDPYAHLSDPSYGGCDYTNHNAGSSISPGVYCGDLRASGGSLTVQPGTYYIVNGDLRFNSLGNVQCNCSTPGSGVTFVLTGSNPGRVNFNSTDTINLRAPSDSSYDYPGILIYIDRDSSHQTSTFNSIDNLTLNGAIYAPTQTVEFNSIDYTSQTDCAQIVGYRVEFNSIDSFGRSDNCTAYGTKEIDIGGMPSSLVQ